MKICYIGVYRDGTGYSNQAVNNMLALESGGFDVVGRAIKLSNHSNHELAKKVEHLENKSTDNVDVVIQHILPHMFEYKNNIKNIGMFDWETTNFNRANWSQCCNLMDEIWVSSLQNAQAAKDSNVKVPIKILPCACDINRFNKVIQPLEISKIKDKCIFYTIGEMTRRKNIIAIIRAFYTAFTKRDDVVLLIKTNIPGQSSEEAINIIKATIEDIKKSIHIYFRHNYYPPIAVITDFLNDYKIDQLHVTGNIFVSASHGEAWGIPAHDAMGFSNPVILSNWGSYPELIDASAHMFFNKKDQTFSDASATERDSGWLIKGQLTPCFGMVDSFPDLYTGTEYWYEPDIQHLGKCMTQAYYEWRKKDTRRGHMAHKRAIQFSYKNIGKIAQQLLKD